MLREQKDTVGLAQGRRSDLLPKEKEVARATLAEVGIDHKLFHRAQKLAEPDLFTTASPGLKNAPVIQFSFFDAPRPTLTTVGSRWNVLRVRLHF
jgi:hypothetical protein